MLKKPIFTKYITNDKTTELNNVVGLSLTGLNGLTDLLIEPTVWDSLANTSVGSFLTSLYFYPIKVPATGSTWFTRLKILKNTYQDIPCKKLTGQNYYYIGELKVPNPTNFYDYSGYTRYEVFLPYYGTIEVNPNDVVGKYIQIRLLVDFNTGSACYYVGVSNTSSNRSSYLFDDDDDEIDIRVLGTYVFQLGINIPLGSTNADEKQRNIILGTVKTLATVAISAATAGVGAPIVSAMSAVSSVSSGMQTLESATMKTSARQLQSTALTSTQIYNDYGSGDVTAKAQTGKYINPSEAFNNAMQAIHNSSMRMDGDKPNSTVMTYAYNNTPLLITYKPDFVPITNEYKHLYGVPVGKTLSLSLLEGYTEISKIHIEGDAFKEATNDEINMLYELLTGGIIL